MVCIALLTIWGVGVGLMIGILDWNFNPFIVFKIIFGFFGGMYLSTPNFGLFQESTIPGDEQRRHRLISHYPQVIFAIVVLTLFYLNYVHLPAEFTASETEVFSRIISKATTEELSNRDIATLKSILREYNERTGKKIRKDEVDVLTRRLKLVNEYYGELGQSLLISWNRKSRFTTTNFDRVLDLMKKFGGRKPEKIRMDLACLDAAAKNQSYVQDEQGTRFEFGREKILEKIHESEISHYNFGTIIKVLNAEGIQ